MLSNAYFLAKFRFDTAENEPAKNLQNFAINFFINKKVLQKIANVGDWAREDSLSSLERHATLDAPRLERRNSSEGLRPRTG